MLTASEQNPKQRKWYWELVGALREENSRLIFLDESSANTDLTRRYGWSARGERVHGQVPRNTPKAHSIIGALGPKGMLATMEIEGAVDGEAFSAFIRQSLAPKLKKGDVVVLDNCRTHFREDALQTLEGKGVLILFLPAYSPDLNPIELCWSKLKNLLRTAAARTHSALTRAISEALDQITPQNAKAWFEHLGYWVPSN